MTGAISANGVIISVNFVTMKSRRLRSDVYIIPSILDEHTCNHCIQMAEVNGWENSTIGSLPSGTGKNNARKKTLINIEQTKILESVRTVLPSQTNGMEFRGLSRTMQCFRYGAGEEFSIHTDSPEIEPSGAKSLYTVVVYLNSDFGGGQTVFPRISLQVTPITGMGIVFRHDEPHASLPVTHGAKYILRTTVMYAP